MSCRLLIVFITKNCLRVQAEKILLDDLNSGKINKEYLPVVGLQSFLDVTSQVE